MALTVNEYANRFDMLSDRVHTGYLDITFDSSYAYDGESLAAGLAKLGFRKIHNITAESKNGYTFVPDISNEKLKVFAPAPPTIHEEYVTVTSNVGYLKYPAAHINYIAGCTAAGTPDTSKIPIAGGVTPAAGQCAVDMGYNDTTGVLTKFQRTSLTFLAADAVVGAYVSYATQAWVDLTDNMEMCKVTGVGADEGLKVYGNAAMVSDPVVDADILRLGVDVVAVQSITWSDGGDAGTIKVPELLVDGGTPAATLEMEIDFAKATTFAEIVCNANDMLEMVAGDIVRVVYIKNPGAGTFLNDRFVNATIADATDTYTWTGKPLIYGSCGQLPMGTSDKKCYWVAEADALAATQVHWTTSPFGNAPVATAEGATDDDITPAWIKGDPAEIVTQPLEIPNGTDLSALANVRVTITGILKN